MPPLPARFTLTLAGLLLAPALAWAQEEPELPEVQRHYDAREAAVEAAGKALGTLEAFGRESRAPLTAEQARSRALSRIHGVHPQPRQPLQLDPQRAQEELEQFREALLSRLRELDPQRYPEPSFAIPKQTRPRFRIYEVSDLTVAPPDHVAPTVGLAMGDGRADDVGGGSVAQPVLGAEVLLELIEERLSESEREREGHSIEVVGGRLAARLPLSAHAKIKALLTRLRDLRAGQLLVELRFYRLPREVYAQLAPHAAGFLPADEKLLEQAVAAKRAELLSTRQVVAGDGQRIVVRQGGSRAIVGDIEVNQTGVIPVLNPVVRNVNEGLVLELRGIADRAEKVVHLDLSLTRAQLTKGGEVRKLSGIEVELPELSLTRTAASQIVPMGRGALLAGSFATGADDEAVVVYTRVRLTTGKD